MRKRFLLAAALGFFLTACAGNPAPEVPPPAPEPEPAAFDPTGTYDIVVTAQGMEIGGVMTIEGSAAEGYKGYIDTEMGGAALLNVVLGGLTMTFEIPDAGMVAEIIFEGDEFSGDMSGGMGDATIQGVKRSGD
ncbi:MAG: hypothetical protein JSW51_09615 [Gemmatimonadota bacterium]|nr:MAG: hypothetical protein JSW51_09615 [Gemmatimonadota bacterium]